MNVSALIVVAETIDDLEVLVLGALDAVSVSFPVRATVFVASFLSAVGATVAGFDGGVVVAALRKLQAIDGVHFVIANGLIDATFD